MNIELIRTLHEEEEQSIPLTPSFGPDWDLLEKRYEAKVMKGMLMPIHTMNVDYTPQMQLDEVKNRTTTGYRFMLAEQGLLEYLLHE